MPNELRIEALQACSPFFYSENSIKKAKESLPHKRETMPKVPSFYDYFIRQPNRLGVSILLDDLKKCLKCLEDMF